MSHEASSSTESRRVSYVNDIGRRRSSCGYCKSGKKSSISYGLWALKLTVNDYQDLLDRGWRRSGCFLYKPEMETTCCPCYTIRLRAADFIPSKEQSRVTKRMQRYVDGKLEPKKEHVPGDKFSNSQGYINCKSTNASKNEHSNVADEEKSKEEQLLHFLSEKINHAVELCVQDGKLPSNTEYPKGLVKKVSQTKKRRLVDGSEDMLYSSSISFQLAALLKREKSADNGACESGSLGRLAHRNGLSLELSPIVIAEKLASSLQHVSNISDLSIRACNGHINFYSAIKKRSVGENQSAAPSNNSSVENKNKGHVKQSEEPESKKRKLEIRLNRSGFDPEEFALFQKYQILVHNDTPERVEESSYRRFLVDTPLVYVPPSGDGSVPPCGFGSFHQQYRIDGRLVAVGVFDILPKCLSSKYLFWDPEFAFLSLGKFGALNEIDWVKKNEEYCPSLQYYYLGYYIHSCPKMKYKAEYRPSDLLCPLRYQWVPHSKIKHLLDKKKYVVLSDYNNPEKGESPTVHEPEDPPQDELAQENQNDVFITEADDGNSNYESSDDESFPEMDDELTGYDNVDVSNVLVGNDRRLMRYKELDRLLSSAHAPEDYLEKKIYFERILQQYVNVVGAPLSERMIYRVW